MRILRRNSYYVPFPPFSILKYISFFFCLNFHERKHDFDVYLLRCVTGSICVLKLKVTDIENQNLTSDELQIMDINYDLKMMKTNQS